MSATCLGRSALVACVLVAGSSAAQVKPQPPETRIKVVSFSIHGLHAFGESEIKRELATRSSGWIPWSRAQYFDPEAFEADKRRIETFYATRGYPKARVESAETRFNEAHTEVDLVMRVVEGEPILVDAVDLVGFEGAPADHVAKVRAHLPIKVEQPLDRRLALESRTILATELRDHGFPHADVEIRAEPATESAAHLTFTAKPGTKAVFGPIEITGNTSVSDEVIRRQLLYRPGDLFRISRVHDSQRKLYTQKLFQFVNVDVEAGSEGAAEVPTRVTVAEGKHRQVELGGGWGSEEHLRGEARWQHVNFLGGARTASVHGKWSSLDRGVRLRLNQPYLFHPHFVLDVEGHSWYANEPAYEVQSYGGQISVAHRANTTTTWSVTAVRQYESSAVSQAALADLSLRDEIIALGLDPSDGRQRGTLTAFQFDVARNTTTQPLDPLAGSLLSAHLEQSGRWLPGDFEYYSLVLEGRHYVTVLDERLVFANRMRLGSIDPLSTKAGAVPFFKRFFLGGSSSVRGWGRFELGPLGASGLPLGGHSMLEASSEIRWRLTKSLGVVAFLDAGNVWADAWQFPVGSLKYAVGPGLRYYTPIGPMRVDLGYQLTPTPELLVNGRPQVRTWRLHFSIGQAF
ncbi:MAG: BamA/TamA family outer membrane protein [Acidobacteria bacterium]|nr:BamA/TamA family outer membrane protein [Acidobacteriota bacterium]